MRSIAKSALAAALALGLVAVSQAPAQAATYTWFNGLSRSNTTFFESTAAGSYSRTGVGGELLSANGPLFQTTTWFGTAYTVGFEVAIQYGPRSFQKGKTKWISVQNPNNPTSLKFQAWLVDAKLTGTSRLGGEGVAQAEGGEAASTPAPALVPGLENADLSAIDTATLQHRGVAGGFDIWSARGHDGQPYLITSQDGYVGVTSTSTDNFEKHGLSITSSQGGTESVQAVLVPSGLDTGALKRSGLQALDDTLFVNSGRQLASTISLDAPGPEADVTVSLLQPAAAE